MGVVLGIDLGTTKSAVGIWDGRKPRILTSESGGQSIPSHFDEAQRRATKEAARIAGIEVLRLLNEATAAILAYGIARHADEQVVVFDLGGGTLDVSVADIGEGVFEIKAIEGASDLGLK